MTSGKAQLWVLLSSLVLVSACDVKEIELGDLPDEEGENEGGEMEGGSEEESGGETEGGETEGGETEGGETEGGETEGGETEGETEGEVECLPLDQPVIGSFQLTSDADADALIGASVIQGNLGIGWGIEDLSALSCIQRITGALWIVETGVWDLSPLAGLSEVGGEFELGMTSSLVNAEFPVLDRVAYLSIYNNVSLTKLEMPALHTVLQNAEVDDNVNLPTCDVTEIRDNLDFLGGTFYQSGNFPDGCN